MQRAVAGEAPRAAAILVLALGAAVMSGNGLSAEDAAAPRHTNRLAKEKSPYLLQHAHNPVDWYPWGPEALAKAQREGKPIFLSIGYSPCHWCHVMEKESFENEDIARVMNEHFVSIKVDREERPDIDHLYMTAVMAMTGQGGWPMSTFLTPDGRPFYGGTYFPPDDRYGRPGFKRVLLTLADAWKNKRDDLLATAGELTRILHEVSRSTAPGGAALDASTLKTAFESLRDSFDEHDGGFGGAPKFPRPHALTFLLRYHARAGEHAALHMAEVTLDRMASGGIHDQIGGGFHRYSTDGKWLVPHFEKMLYDQALLARAYLEAHQATRNPEQARVARRIFEYVLRDLTDPSGGFYSAEDADSEGVEGKFYVWTPAELERVLGPEDGKRAAKMLGVTKEGNFEHGWSILHLPQPVTGLDRAWLDGVSRKMLEVRSTRIRPHRDDKVLASWNGLMISALAYGAQVLDDTRYSAAAARAADFVLTNMRRPDGRLLRRYRAGEAAVLGYLDDYAFMTLGLLDLYEATFDPRWLKEATGLAREMVRLFHDDAGAAFYDAAADAERLVARPRDLDDGAVPSGNSVAALVLLRLGRLTADAELEAQGRRVLDAVAGAVARMPSGFTQLLAAVDFSLGPTREIVLAGDPAAPATQALLKALRGRYLPRTVVALHPVGPDGKAIEALIPYLTAQGPVNGKPAAYVCENYACLKPVISPAEFSKLLSQ